MRKVIISLGGSLIYPDRLDIDFLNELKKLIYGSEERFVLYCGGGALARKWQKIASHFIFSRRLLDWIGIFATRVNAKSVMNVINEDVHERIVTNPTKKIIWKEKILIAAGWKPGWSTDFDAVLLAKNLGIDTVINVSNIKYAYDKDPKKFKDAKPIKKIAWKDFRKIVGDKWSPGLNMPFDPIASKEAEKIGIKVIIVGKDLENLKKVLENKNFVGTVVER